MADLTHVVINQAHCSYIASRPRYGQNAMTSEVTTTNDTSKHKHIVEEQWRTVLRQEKLESLRKELRLLQDYHEQDLAHKHATLERLESEFGTAEDQYRSAHAVHVQRLRQLVDLYEERLLSMEADFQGKLEHLQQEYTSEREAIVAQHDGNRQVLLGQIEALKTQEKGRQVQDERARHQAIEEVKGRAAEDINNLQFILEGKREDLEEQFEAVEIDYLQNNDHKATDYQDLCAEESKMKHEIDDLVRRIDRLQGAAKRVNAASRRNYQQRSEKSNMLTYKKCAALEQYQSTKGKMDHTRESQYRRIAALTAQAKEYKEDLQIKYDLAERILKLIAATTKLEMSMDMQGQDGIDGGACATRGNTENEPESGENEDLDLSQIVQNRYSRAVQLMGDQEERLREAKKTNKDLKAKLKRFEDGTSLNDDVLRANGGNPLFVINGRLGMKG